ncbi:MAG TPA: helicase-related protein, partial [Tepidisphaeraceae bacterium]|nr:helicase-related protein [Tepidisphaeraceae bacterium]
MLLPLPIDPFIPQVLETLRASGALVLVAEPGAGKTTRVPPAIIRSNLLDSADQNRPNQKLVMLQPRRVAARAAAARIADEQKWSLGNEVGYQIRFEKRLTDATRLRVLTEGILTRQLVADPFLEGIGCVILDEFHERSIDVDLALAMLREIRASVRPDLKLFVMSATLAAESVSAALGNAPIIRVPGRVFPVTVEQRSPSSLKLIERVASEIQSVVESSPDSRDHILVFLPGAEEIRRTERAIESLHDRFDLDIFQLHGSLDFEEQQRALRETGRRRIILSTNIAETSLTIDGVTVVIDSGLARVPRFDPKRGLDRLELVRISKASAEQRKGRAGRTAPGKCVRLWSSAEQNAMDDFETPEIQRVDL